MDIQQKLTGFAILNATWVTWLLVGLTVGGVAAALERAVWLVSTTDGYRRVKARARRILRGGRSPAEVRC